MTFGYESGHGQTADQSRSAQGSGWLAFSRARHRATYTVTVDYWHRTTTGISAHDRALTMRALPAAWSSIPESGVTAASFARPRHMVPLRAETRRRAYSSKTARA